MLVIYASSSCINVQLWIISNVFNVWVELTAKDCLNIGIYAFYLGEYARAVEWIEESYILAGLENNSTVTQDAVIEVLDEVQDAVLLTKPLINYCTFGLTTIFLVSRTARPVARANGR